jgi:hypothetical protein
MNREPSQDYRSLSPGSDESPDASGEDIPPLAFESEAELLSVLIRLRAGLAEDLRSKWEELMGDEDELKKAETIVLEVSSTTTIHLLFIPRLGSRDATTV